jgi:hypothetical protein
LRNNLAEAARFQKKDNPAEAACFQKKDNPAEAARFQKRNNPAEAARFQKKDNPAEAARFQKKDNLAEAARFQKRNNPAERKSGFRQYLDNKAVIMDITGITAIITMFGVLPALTFRFIAKNMQHKREMEVEKLKIQKEILELEVQKQNGRIKLLEEENKNLDNLISGQ